MYITQELTLNCIKQARTFFCLFQYSLDHNVRYKKKNSLKLMGCMKRASEGNDTRVRLAHHGQSISVPCLLTD